VLEKERILKEAKEKAEKETQLAIDSAMRQIEFEKNKAIRDVREEIATLSVAVAEKIIRGKIEKESGQKEVISRLIDEITLSKS
jgi:F-type H+-transporting ATPase subunit b